MSDLIAVAKERRTRLNAEIAKLDEFIHMAEMLLKYSPSKSGDGGDDQRGDRSGPAVVRPMPRA
jgi:hypothetical protein